MAMGNWTADLRRAARSLGRSVGFTTTTVATLALTIGAAAAMFAVVEAVLLAPLPYAQPERLVYIGGTAPGSQLPPEFDLPGEFYVHYSERSGLLDGLSLYSSFTNTLRTPERVERVRMSIATNSMYRTLGVQPAVGRAPVDADGRDVLVISHRLWTDWFGGDPGVIGRSVQVAGGERTIIGIMGPEFRFPDDDTLLWLPVALGAADITAPGRPGNPLVARLKPGATPDALTAELNQLARQLPERFGGPASYARTIEQFGAVVRPLKQHFVGDASRALWVLLAAAAIVMLIACANVANLFLVRTEGRQRELAVRRALGAGRRQLVRLQLAEALVIAALGGGLAVLVAAAIVPAFLGVAPDRIPRMDQVALGPETLGFALGAALLAALLCGLVPALRGSIPDLARLRDGGRGSTTRRHRLRNLLVAGQTALALLLLIGSALLFRSADALLSTDPGYETSDIFSFQIAPDRPSLDSAPAFARFNLAFLDRLAALPGVESAGLVENLPLEEGTNSVPVRSEGMAGPVEEGPRVQVTFTAGDYFPSMGIALLAGRPFADSDHLAPQGSAVVSRSAAERLWPGEDPVGKRLELAGREGWQTVVGVVEDVRQFALAQTPEPLVYLPMVDTSAEGGRSVSSPAFVVRSSRANTIAADVRALVREVAPEAPMYRTFTMEALVQRNVAQLSFTLFTMGVAALLSLLLGAIGLYGVLSYIVAERTREIGLRMALGASASQVRRIVVGQGTRVVAIGIAVGLVAALAFTRVLDTLLYGVGAFDLPVFALMALAMLGVGALASYLPARRASSMDPSDSLRRE